MTNLALTNKKGELIRFFHCQTKKACLVYRQDKGRLDICSSPDFFNKDSTILIDEFEISEIKKKKEIPLIEGALEVCAGPVLRSSIPRAFVKRVNPWLVLALALGVYVFLAGGLYFFSPFKNRAEDQKRRITQIIKPPVLSSAQRRIIGDRKMFIPYLKKPVKKKVLKRSLKKIGALSALGDLSKKDSQKRGLSLSAGKVSAGPGFRAVARSSGSGGVQDSLYSRGMISAALGSGGNIRGGGGHGTKGSEQGGGSSGYGALTLVGAEGGEESDSFSSSSSGQKAGGWDMSLIDKEIIKKIGAIRKCYDQALKEEPDLKGLLKIRFAVNSKGKVDFSKIHPSSKVRSQKVSSCILSIIDQIQFPIPFKTVVSMNYVFDLSALDKEGGS